MGEIVTTVLTLSIVIEYLVDGIKEVLPTKWTSGKERIIALAVSVVSCLLLPCITVIPIGKLAELNVVERIILGIFVSRGSNILYDLFRKLQGGKEGLK